MSYVQYKRCSDVDMSTVFKAFTIGFSDYIIRLEMDEDFFTKRFFEAEGNSRETSFIAFSGYTPVGFIMGGIKDYEGIKTMRCGTLCIHPDFRGLGVSQELFKLHREEAIKKGCKQLFLEVILGNDRAINFYKKLGYEKIYKLKYFSLKDISKLERYNVNDASIKEVGLEELKTLRSSLLDVHINWQNDIECIEKYLGQHIFIADIKDDIAGALCISNTGKINFLWIPMEYRNKSIATALIKNAVKNLNLSKISISFPSSASLEGYLKHMEFEKDSLEQYEMYLTL